MQLKTHTGNVAVAMDALPSDVGGIFVHEQTSERTHYGTGEVVATGDEVYCRYGVIVPPPLVGTRVICDPRAGNSYEVSRGQTVKVFGAYFEVVGEALRCPWWEGILATLENGQIRATGDNVLVRLDKPAEVSEGGILIPAVAQSRSSWGVIESVGPIAASHGLEVGMRVYFDNARVPAASWGLGKEMENVVIAPLDAIDLYEVCEGLDG